MNLDRVCSNPTCSNMTMIVLASASISIFLMLLMTPAMITVKQRMGQREPQKRDENALHAMAKVHFDQFSAVTKWHTSYPSSSTNASQSHLNFTILI